jgi:hypothetical protein
MRRLAAVDDDLHFPWADRDTLIAALEDVVIMGWLR